MSSKSIEAFKRYQGQPERPFPVNYPTHLEEIARSKRRMAATLLAQAAELDEQAERIRNGNTRSVERSTGA